MKPHNGTRGHFAENLRFLCSSASSARSVSQACRHLDINRQQFARYLNGQYLPSLRNVRRICEFFGVAEAEIFLTPERFRSLGARQTAVANQERPMRFARPEQPFADGAERARRYAGYWFRYLRSVAYPGMIIKAAVKIFENEARVCVKSLERLKHEQTVAGRNFDTFKYRGTLVLLADRLFIVEMDILLRNAITETILYAAHKHPLTLVFGEAFGISSGPSREAYMTPIVYEFVGVQTDLRALLRACRLYREDSAAIDNRVRSYVTRRERV